MTRKDLGFRLITGAVAAAIVVIVCGIGFVLTQDAWVSIQKFGVTFWRTQTWDPVSGEFGADCTRNRGLRLRAVPGGAPPAAGISHRASGSDSLHCVRAVGNLRARTRRPID